MNHNAAFIQLPIGLEKECEGILDVIEERAIYFDGDYGEKILYDEVPKDKRSEVQERRHELIEHLSNVDEALGKQKHYYGSSKFRTMHICWIPCIMTHC